MVRLTFTIVLNATECTPSDNRYEKAWPLLSSQYICPAKLNCLKLLIQWASRPFNLALCKTGRSNPVNIAKIDIKAYNAEDDYVETSLPFKVVRPVEVKHFGKYELAEVYEPVPVTGCIPGTIGSSVQYSESESETRQNSVSITYNKSWSDSNSTSLSSSNN